MFSKEEKKEKPVKMIEEGESCEIESGAGNDNCQLEKYSSIQSTGGKSKKKDVQEDNTHKYNYNYHYNYNFGSNYHYEYNYKYNFDFANNNSKGNNTNNSKDNNSDDYNDDDEGDNRKKLFSVNTATCTAANTCTNALETATNTATCTNTTVTCPKVNNRTGEKTELSFTAFRAIEKKYKLYQMPKREARRNWSESQRRMEIDYTDVVQFGDLSANSEANKSMIHVVQTNDPNVPCYTFAGVPGLLVFPNALTQHEQVHWCKTAILDFVDSAKHPNILSMHAKAPVQTTCYQPPMRWSLLGFTYDWTSKTYSPERYSSYPEFMKSRMTSFVKMVAQVNQDQFHCSSPETYEPQTCIVNYYPVGSMMMCHQDISEEVLDQPLVSVSLGCSSIFLMGTESRDDSPYAFLLRSGDVAAFSGPARAAFHSVPRILDDCPDYLTIPYSEMTPEEASRYDMYCYYAQRHHDKSFAPLDKYAMSEDAQERYWRLCMRHMRVNINARQVYPQHCDFLYE